VCDLVLYAINDLEHMELTMRLGACPRNVLERHRLGFRNALRCVKDLANLLLNEEE